MVCHGSHQYTPVMLALFYQHLPAPAGSVMGLYPAFLFVTQNHPIESREPTTFIELDDGKILTGKPDQFDGKLTIQLFH